ncbi:hypothetical protein N7516_007653 [Penicillium verrucosum]|uniref:uncharacterized protein n=1 Tax=Penicillium verrucosum TaxID=60171 RepID=UPI002544FA2F|nr:uncharacterized protein N7516_007653 [Penicillium verrucosum]KAJ5933164.1 hypothetical protein N7516_007653 [Penicillium verrucosum]
MSNQPVHIISDTGSESESDGGMQLDSMQLEDLYGSLDGTPMPMSDTRLLNVDGTLMPRPRPEDEFWGLNTSNGSDERRYHANAQNPLTTPYNSTDPNRQSASQTAFEKDVRTRSHLRDEKHAALAVLMDSELLVTYALASRETIPQTRRRFLAKYLAPNDPEKAEELYDPRFYIAPNGKGSEGGLIRGRYREVIGDINDHNWHKPAQLRELDAKKGRGGGVAFPWGFGVFFWGGFAEGGFWGWWGGNSWRDFVSWEGVGEGVGEEVGSG